MKKLIGPLMFALLIAVSSANAHAREPGIGCSQWDHFPITCQNAYCIYNDVTQRCQEDHGDNPRCEMYDGQPKICIHVYHCYYDAASRRCDRE